jgi:hypothetical protein
LSIVPAAAAPAAVVVDDDDDGYFTSIFVIRGTISLKEQKGNSGD